MGNTEQNEEAAFPNENTCTSAQVNFTLDYSLKDPQQRNKLVHKIIQNTPKEKLTPYYLQKLTRYLLEEDRSASPAESASPSHTKRKYNKNKSILTDNHMVSINRHETSLQGLITKFQNGEDGIYNFIAGWDKNLYLIPKIKITTEDEENVPGLKELTAAIKVVDAERKVATGKRRYNLIKQLKEMRYDQYLLRSSAHPPIFMTRLTKSISTVDLTEHIHIDPATKEPVSDCIVSIFNPQHISAVLCNYSTLRQESRGNFQSDWYYFMQSFDAAVESALAEPYPILYDILIMKIDGLTNKQIAAALTEKYSSSYSIEYISSLWRNKIPKLIAEKNKQNYLNWYYTERERGQWKRCSRCKQIKLAHPYYYSKNKSSKDGYYSMCKCCRNKKSGLG